MTLDGSVVAITGASGGLGDAIARQLADRGAHLILTGRDRVKLGSLVDDLPSAFALTSDVTDPDLAERLLAAAESRFGPLDVLINNAGVLERGGIADLDIEAACRMIEINLTAAVRLTYAALRHFLRRGRGHVINMSSIAGIKIMYPEVAAYTATKHALEALSESLRPALAGSGVSISCIEPGLVRTGLYDRWNEADRAAMQQVPALEPADVARSVVFVLEQPDHVRVPKLFLVPAGEAH